jgi:hypothetical protein
MIEDATQKAKCITCKFHHKVNKHPWNEGDRKGSIQDRLGWCCTVFAVLSTGPVIFHDSEHGGCELHTEKELNPEQPLL